MNHIVNDKGQTVIAVGAENSEMRAAQKWPALIEKINALYFNSCENPGRAVDEAIELIRAAGITSAWETIVLLEVSAYGLEPAGSVTGLVKRFS